MRPSIVALHLTLLLAVMPSTRAAPKRPADSEGETTSKQAKPDDDIEKFSVAKMASTITRQIIHTAKAPAAVGPYSQAVRVGDTIYLSGSIGFVPETMELAKGGVEAEAHQALKNIGEVLKAAGVGYGNVVKTTVLLKSIDDFARVNAIYTEYFTEKYPARAAYQVAALPKNALVEIEAIAVTGKIVDV